MEYLPPTRPASSILLEVVWLTVYPFFQKRDENHSLAHPTCPQSLQSGWKQEAFSRDQTFDGSFLQLYTSRHSDLPAVARAAPSHLSEGEDGFPAALLFAFGSKAPASPIQTWVQGMAATQTHRRCDQYSSNNKENGESQALLLQAAASQRLCFEQV